MHPQNLHGILIQYIRAIRDILSEFITKRETDGFRYEIHDQYYARFPLLEGTCELFLCESFTYLLVSISPEIVRGMLPAKLTCIAGDASALEGEHKTRIYLDSPAELALCRALFCRLYQAVKAAKSAYQSALSAPVPDAPKPPAPQTLEEYIVIDLETTGLDVQRDEILEIGAIHVVSGRPNATFHMLVRPAGPISTAAASVNGITPEMVADAQPISAVFPQFADFIRDLPLVGHNIDGFDGPFCNRVSRQVLGRSLKNRCADTMSMAKALSLPQPYPSLAATAAALHVAPAGAHRALTDCETTLACFEAMRRLGIPAALRPIRRGAPISAREYQKYQNIPKAKDIVPTVSQFDKSGLLFDKTCVISGDIDGMTREQAMQAVANAGGHCADNVTKKTDILILGRNPNPNQKSGKQKKAEEYAAAGQNIQLLPGREFLSLIKPVP